MKNKKFYTLEEAKRKFESYCVYQERCHAEIESKLYEMYLSSKEKEEVILHLLEHDFLNEERFSKSYARGKFYIKKWGKDRIVRELKHRKITSYNITKALLEIDEDEYLATFNELAEKKNAQLTETDIQKRRKKLIDYLRYRGWESHLVYDKVLELTS
ncbi:RecX family transcriptional regulator [Aureibaculum marinum]|uniref:Regulatory protein RecX n=1 Tax=Aureibaculum marinum TaxID=2487930 RepID=A0A3N4NZS0_9FLAO|nr:regulatory protein RecX [Aureibaculum marinum]RPD97770.1 RecX family transcriptional regulator [Aureibaculum marinum]